jgi:bifunctional non-homologous end joining protein LigD
MIAESKESIKLFYRDSRSDKVYQMQLDRVDGGYVVNFQFGRRGSTLQSGTKTPQPVSNEKASKIYERLVAEKRAKGYTEAEGGAPYANSSQAGRQSGLLPQLLNPIDESAVDALIDSDDWYMQEKKDGCRLLVRKTGETVEGINRKGAFVGLSKAIEQAVRQIDGDVVLDGEAIGDQYWVFDLLELHGEDQRGYGVAERFHELALLAQELPEAAALRIVPSALTKHSKRKVFEALKAARAEGVVFKHRDAKYKAGRPASGGEHLKCKFTATATCHVLGQNEGKRSVALAVYQDPGDGFVEVGNVTIPPNFDIPRTGSLVEVRYLYARLGGSLYQPVYLGPRLDWDAADSAKSLKFKQGEDEES